jgi:hypothetical protein
MASAAVITVMAVPLLVCHPARAEGIDSRDRPGPLALRLELGLGGAAAGAVVRLGPAGLRATAGLNLEPIIVSDAESHEIDSIEFDGTWQLNGEAFLFPLRLENGTEIGFSLAARHSDLLGNGGGAAVELRRQVQRRIGFTVAGGLTVFPDGTERIREDRDLGPEVDVDYPFGADLHLGATVGLNLDVF